MLYETRVLDISVFIAVDARHENMAVFKGFRRFNLRLPEAVFVRMSDESWLHA